MATRALTTCLTLLIGLTGATGLDGFALCFGSDGQVEVKDLRNPSCGEGETDGTARWQAEACCQGCLDIPLGAVQPVEIRRGAERRASRPAPPGPAPRIGFLSCAGLRPHRQPGDCPAHPPPISADPIPTTVLLI